MPFQKGNKLSPGRQVGSLNKRSVEFYQQITASGFDAAKEMMWVYEEAKKTFQNYGTIYQAIVEAKEEQSRSLGYSAVPPEDKADKYLKICLDVANNIAAYCYPKPKFPEQVKGALDDMTAEQKLQALRNAVALLEGQVKDGK